MGNCVLRTKNLRQLVWDCVHHLDWSLGLVGEAVAILSHAKAFVILSEAKDLP